MADIRIAFIGAGNMAGSIIGGLIAGGHPARAICASSPDQASREALEALVPVRTLADNAEAAAAADVIVLAVKPAVVAAACADIAPAVAGGDKLVISVAAGVPAASLRRWLGDRVPVVRCMPNTPALLGCAASALYAASDVDDSQRSHANMILSAVGLVCWVPDEEALHAATALAGSGPAYFFLFMEAMAAEGERLGLDRETAAALTAQTCLGAARMAAESGSTLAELRRRVCSPGGTTERAVDSFRGDDLEGIVARAMSACLARSRELAGEFD